MSWWQWLIADLFLVAIIVVLLLSIVKLPKILGVPRGDQNVQKGN
jgi:hypothetical protein